MADATLENGNGPPHIEKDEEELAEFGYKQELKRDWGLTHNFGISFSIIVCYYALTPFLIPFHCAFLALEKSLLIVSLRSRLSLVSRHSSDMG